MRVMRLTWAMLRNCSATHFPTHGFSAAMQLPLSDSFSSRSSAPTSSGSCSIRLPSRTRILRLGESARRMGPGSSTSRLEASTSRVSWVSWVSMMGRATILLFVASRTFAASPTCSTFAGSSLSARSRRPMMPVDFHVATTLSSRFPPLEDAYGWYFCAQPKEQQFPIAQVCP